MLDYQSHYNDQRRYLGCTAEIVAFMTSTFAERPPVTRLPAMVTATLKQTYSECLLGFAMRTLHFPWQPSMHVCIITYMRHIARAHELKDNVTKAAMCLWVLRAPPVYIVFTPFDERGPGAGNQKTRGPVEQARCLSPGVRPEFDSHVQKIHRKP